MRAVDVLEALELVAAPQRGLVSSAQAQLAGVSKMMLSRMAGRGTLQRVRHGVYALPSGQGDRLMDLRAAWVAAGATGDVVVSGASAAVVHGLGDVIAARHEFTAASRKQSSQPDVHFRRQQLPASDVVWVDGLPVTTVSRTVADLAAAGMDFDHLVSVVRDAAEKAGVSHASLAEALESAATAFGHGDGASLLASLLDASGYRVDTTLLQYLPPSELLGALSTRLGPDVTADVMEQLLEAIEVSEPHPEAGFAQRRLRTRRRALVETA